MRGETWQVIQPDVYVVGCGPSMKSFNWEVLRPFTTIAVNGAILSVPEATFFLTACSAFATRAFRSDFWNTQAKRVLIMGQDHKNYARVQPFLSQFDEVRAPSRYDGEIGFTWDAFATGKNSGFCGMQYATLLGAQTIHLVGMDLTGSASGAGGGSGGTYTVTLLQPMVFDLDDDGTAYRTEVFLGEW